MKINQLCPVRSERKFGLPKIFGENTKLKQEQMKNTFRKLSQMRNAGAIEIYNYVDELMKKNVSSNSILSEISKYHNSPTGNENFAKALLFLKN
jgi:hypothetical protein